MQVDQSICQSDQGYGSFTKTCATIGSLIIVLLTLLQVKYGNKDASPFETHRLIMTLFIVAMLTYALTAVAAIKFQTWFTNHSLILLLNQICIAFGFLACDLLLLILAPLLGYFFLVICVLILLYPVHELLRKYEVSNKVQTIFHECMEHTLRLLPATVTPDSDSATPSMAQISMVQPVGSSEITKNSNEMNV
ncbi:hypothetical protein PTKIN_Ptkin03bG0225500 [Pterospermum kingtungense]